MEHDYDLMLVMTSYLVAIVIDSQQTLRQSVKRMNKQLDKKTFGEVESTPPPPMSYLIILDLHNLTDMTKP